MAESILPQGLGCGEDAGAGSMWLTTAAVAKRLGVTARWVRWLAQAHELPCDVMESGQRVFRRVDVGRYLVQRADRQARSRAARLRALRPRMVYAALEPRQLSLVPLLVGRRALRTVWDGERPDPHAEVKAARSFEKACVSEKENSVNRKARAS